MPYASGDVPTGTEGLPPRARAVFKAAANSAYKQYGEDDEARVHRIAWGAVKNAGFRKNKDGKWVAEDAADAWSEEAREAALEARRAGAKGEPEKLYGSVKPLRGEPQTEEEKTFLANAISTPVRQRTSEQLRAVRNAVRRADNSRKAAAEGAPPQVGTKEWEKKADKYYAERGKEDPKIRSAYRMGKRAGEGDENPFVGGETSKAWEHGRFVSGSMKGKDAMYIDREFSASQRESAAEEGNALPGGGFPINNEKDLRNAMRALGRAKDRAATVRLIRRRARELGVDIGADWPGTSDALADRVTRKKVTRDPRGRLLSTSEEEEEDDIWDSADLVSDPIVVMGEAVPGVGDSAPATMFDSVELDDAAGVSYTQDGYLKAMPRVARTGVQQYRGAEVGRRDVDVVRIFRPESEVFADGAVKSYTHLPVTLDHPSEMVGSGNWRDHAVGETGEEVLRDGGSVRVPMMLRDGAAIAAYKAGRRQLSLGYDCDIDWTPGTTDGGESYDAVQRNIRANHLAVVAAARGGPSLKIGDGSEKETAMNRTILVDGIECQMTDAAAVIVQRTVQGLQQQLQDARKNLKAALADADEQASEYEAKDAKIKDHSKALAAKDAEIAARDETIRAKDAEIAGVKAQLKDAQDANAPEKLDAMVVDRLTVIQKAKAFLGDKWTSGGKSAADIRREVVGSKVGDALAKGWTDAEVTACFAGLQVPSFSQGGKESPRSPIDDAVAAFGRPGGGYTTMKDQKALAYDNYDKEIGEAWRGKAN